MSGLTELLSTAGRRSEPVLAVVAGTGQVARCAVEGGAHLVLVLNAGLYRNLGTGSLAAFLPYGNANEQTLAILTQHVLPRIGATPVVAGVLGADPTRSLDEHLAELKRLGVAGVTNWPAADFFDGALRGALDEDGVGLESELRMLEAARRIGLRTFGFALLPASVRQFTEAGVDGLILNLGLTRGYEDQLERRDQIQRTVARLRELLDAVGAAHRRPLCLAFGGPITAPDDLEQLLLHTEIDGFAGGSVFERLPVQSAVTSLVRRFKGLGMHPAADAGHHGLGPLIGRSPAMRELFRLIRRVAPFDVNVCIEGETGSGKELVATQIHQLSHRAHRAFVTLNCGAIPDSLLESELFGHERGAFTGADRRRLGKFEIADGGTLFLDEIADLSPHAQVALLRAIQQREITRLGGETPLPIDVRIVAASNRPLARLVAEGCFRADLYYRINHITLAVPPLRERVVDLPLLIEHILAGLRIRLDRPALGVAPEFREKLIAHAWPGNVRELQHLLCQTALLEDDSLLTGRHFHAERWLEAAHSAPGRDGLRRHAAEQALRDARGNKSRAARILGITRKTLYQWLRDDGADGVYGFQSGRTQQ